MAYEVDREAVTKFGTLLMRELLGGGLDGDKSFGEIGDTVLD